jgi:hypothetical protein
MIHRDFGATLRNTNFGIHFHRPDEISATEISLGRQRRYVRRGLNLFFSLRSLRLERSGRLMFTSLPAEHGLGFK